MTQVGWTPHIRIIDNCSTDTSWNCIQAYKNKYPGITALQMQANTGPHHTANLLIRSSTSKYVLFASANDVFVDNNAFIDMYSILEHEEDILLVYGRNSRDRHFSEPEEFSFSIRISARSELGICDNDCMNAATWLYTSSEPLWGLYRACLPRMIPAQPSYGADHVFIGLCALNGGIYGLNRMLRSVDPERRDMALLRKSQSQKTYTDSSNRVELPIESSNMISLCYTYMHTIRNSFISQELQDKLHQDSIHILIRRFYLQIFNEYHRIIESFKYGHYNKLNGLALLEAKGNSFILNSFCGLFCKPSLIPLSINLLAKANDWIRILPR